MRFLARREVPATTCAFVLAAAVHCNPAAAADSAACEPYARRAVQQFQIMQSHPGCEQNLEPMAWSGDYNYHYAGCLQAPQSGIPYALDVRDKHLRACGAIAGDAAQTVPAAAQATPAQGMPSAAPPVNSNDIRDPFMIYGNNALDVPYDMTFGWGAATNEQPPQAPLVWFGGKKLNEQGIYFGFNARGSWAYRPSDQKIWLYTGKSLELTNQTFESMPKDCLAHLARFSPNWQRAAAAGQSAPEVRSPQDDPLLKRPFGIARSLVWVYPTTSTIPVMESPGMADYLGFDDKGTYLLENNRQVIRYNYKTQDKERITAQGVEALPKELVANLRNSTLHQGSIPRALSRTVYSVLASR